MDVATKQYNDFELLYMISDDSVEALEIMIEKYKPLIYSKLKKFKIKSNYEDDYFQEGIIILYNAIKKYDTNSKMSFTNFFDLLLSRRIISLLRKNKQYFENNYICEDVDIVVAYEPKHVEIDYEKIEKLEKSLSSFELIVYKMKYKENLKTKEIANALGVNVGRVYSACDRIKLKAGKRKI